LPAAIKGPTHGLLFDRLGVYTDALMQAGDWALTGTISLIFLWFGSLKFLSFEQEGLKPIISNNPLISWLYTVFGVAGGAQFLGVFEITTGMLIACRLFNPKLSALGGAMGVWSFSLTVTCLFTTPGAFEPGYLLALSPGVGAFLVKDIVLFSACLWILGASLRDVRTRNVA